MASTNAMDDEATRGTVSAVRLSGFGLVALITVSIGNVLVLHVCLALLDYPSEFVGGQFGPLAVGPVVINSAAAAVGATVVYGIIARYSARPDRTFTYVAAAVLVLSFGMFLAPDLAGAPASVYGTLAVMHVTAAAGIVAVLTQVSESEATGSTQEVIP